MIEWRRLRNPAFLVCVILLLVAGVTLNGAIAFFRVHLRKLPIYPPDNRQVGAIPRNTASFATLAEDRLESEAMVEELGTTNYLNRAYVLRESQPDKPIVLDVHLAYYTGMIDTVPHVPERCMVGGGWQIVGSAGVAPLNLDQSGWGPPEGIGREADPEIGQGVVSARTSNQFSDAPGTRVNLPREVDTVGLRTTEFAEPASGARLFAGYFFIANGGVAMSAEDVRLLAFDLKTEYAYYLKVQVSSTTVDSAEELGEYAGLLLTELLPEIMRCVPDWIQVQQGRYPAAGEGERQTETGD